MSPGDFKHEYDLTKLQVIKPIKRDFQMLTTPRLLNYLKLHSYEEFSSDFLLHFIKTNSLFIDVGAHYGYYTILVGTKYPHCRIMSFEPVPENYEILKRNINLNQLTNVEIINIALSNNDGVRPFKIAELSDCSGFSGNPITKTLKIVQVKTARLDSLINETSMESVIIKIDTEGHEICVFEGMEKLLRNTADITLIVEFNPKCLRNEGHDPTDLLRKIIQFGFEIFFINDDKRTIYKLNDNNLESWSEHVPETSPVPGVKTYMNMLCVKTRVTLNNILKSGELSFDKGIQKSEEQEARFRLLSHILEGQKILEISSGSSDLSVEIAKPGFDVLDIDVSESGICKSAKLAKKENPDSKDRFIVMDAAGIEFPDNSFDTVLFPEILEHIKDSRELLEESIRIVRNGGRIIVCVTDGLSAPFSGHFRVFFKDTLTTELSHYTNEIQWHELPFKKWLICSFFISKKGLDVTEGPFVDIMMPTYNGRKYIRNAVKSVLAQTYQNWNLIVVNDGGEDVKDILDEFPDSRIKYIVTEHKGKSHALNVAIRDSNSEFIGYLDDDDIFYPIHLEVLVKAALEQKGDLVYSDWHEVSVDVDSGEFRRQFENRRDIAPWMLIRQNYINHKNILHRRSLLDRTGMYDEQLYILIDWDMIRRLFFACTPHHILSVTSEHFRYYSKGIIANRISGLWAKSPDKVRKSVENIINKTESLSAKEKDLTKALIDAMLYPSYYHVLESDSILRVKDTWLTDTSKVKDFQTVNNEPELQRIEQGIVRQLVSRYQKVIEKQLPPGTRRNHYYNLGLTGIRVILNQGYRSFWTKFKNWFRQQTRPAKVTTNFLDEIPE